MGKKIAFIRIWPTPPIAASVSSVLQKSFPEYEIETTDLIHILKRRKDILLLNALALPFDYGVPILWQPRRFRQIFMGSTYLFQRVKRLINERFAGRQDEFAFTFQLQSLFDTRIAGLPNFIYTDGTHLANQHNPYFGDWKHFSPAWIELEKSIYQNATRIFTRSSDITQSLQQEYGVALEKIACVYAGSNVPTDAGEPDNAGYSNKEILFVGTDWRLKGGPELSQAFLRVLERHPDAHLTIIGCAPNAGLPNCTETGLIPVEEVRAYYHRAAIFCLPTTSEAFGVAFIEAMAHRLPIIATNTGAIPDFVLDGENGYRLTIGDVDGITAALLRLLDNPALCRQFGERGRQLALERYNWDAVGVAIRRHVLAALANPTSQENETA